MTTREFEMFALAAAIAAMWSQIRSWLAWPVGWLVVRRRIDAYSSGPVLGYLQATAKWRPRNGGYYSSETAFVRPLGRAYRVWYEALKEGLQVFWLRGWPLWFSPLELGPPANPRETTVGRFSYLRWTLDWERLLEAASAFEDAASHELHESIRNRFEVTYHGRSSVSDGSVPPSATLAKPVGIGNSVYGQRMIKWKADDLYHRPPLALDALSLRDGTVEAARRVRQWIESKEWFEERGIPWRLGLSLGGPGGTGKTSFARAIAVEHNLPIHVFDLAALDNFGLRDAWRRMLTEAPCVALIEDVDAVFDGRKAVESVLKQGIPLTFDALLNCISGVQAADGVLLIVTSNRPETLDPALLRPGRLDVHVAFDGLDRDGRVKMARRILGCDIAAVNAADDRDMTHIDGVEVSPAVFQERLCRRALAERFGDAA